MKIEKIYIYPVKALRAVELQEAQVTKRGFAHDRKFMMLHVQKDDSGNMTYKNVAVAYYPKSILFHPSINTEKGILTITYKPPNEEPKSKDFPLTPPTDGLETVDVNLHGSHATAYKMPQEYNDWLSSCYGIDVILTYLGPNYRPVLMSTSHNVRRPMKPKNEKQEQPSSNQNTASSWLSTLTAPVTSLLSNSTSSPTSGQENAYTDPKLLTFTDCAPYLITSSKSMEDIHSRFPSPPSPSSPTADTIDIMKFRPNIIISSAPRPWDEDTWSRITITPSSPSSSSTRTKIDTIHHCGRCKSINIDYTAGTPSTTYTGDLLKALQRDRRIDPGVKYSPIFGRYAFVNDGASEGNVVRVGDGVEVERMGDGGDEGGSAGRGFDWEGLHTLPAAASASS